MFDGYLREIYDQHPREKLNMFEHNLEVILEITFLAKFFAKLGLVTLCSFI
jgi:hypothetical protein